MPDGQGNTRALTSSTGTVTDTYSYTSFGEQFTHTGSTTNPYQYTGQQYDSLTGLYDLRARYYNPAMGRFLSQDTNAVNFNNPVELNRYVYTANSPLNRMDPTGYGSATTEYVGITGALIGALTFGAYVAPPLAAFVGDALLIYVAYILYVQNAAGLPGLGGFAPPRGGQELEDFVKGLGKSVWRTITTITYVSLIAMLLTSMVYGNAVEDTIEGRREVPRSVRVRHYSYRIMYNMKNLTIGSPDSTSIWVEYPITTGYDENAIRETVTFFGRNPDLVNGFVEFNVDLSKWQLLPDDMLPDTNSKMIPLVTLDGDISYLGRGFPLYEPRVNPRFFDKTGKPIG